MTQLVFSVYDAAAEAWLSPFVAKTAGIATRMFDELVNQDGHQFNRFPTDYQLFQIGQWDEQTGHMESKPKVDLGMAIQYLEGGPKLEEAKEA